MVFKYTVFHLGSKHLGSKPKHHHSCSFSYPSTTNKQVDAESEAKKKPFSASMTPAVYALPLLLDTTVSQQA